MNRQQKRKKEKIERMMKLKNVEPQTKNPMVFGMFYKDNKKEGFGFTINNMNGENETLMSTIVGIHNDIEDNYDSWSLMGIVNDSEIKEKLNRSLSFWNKYQRIEGRVDNPKPSDELKQELKFDFSDPNFVEHLFNIHYGIFHLLKTGEIQNDEWNGFLFMNKHQNVNN